MIFHPHSDNFFDAEFTHFDSIETLLAMRAHFFSSDPGFTTRIETHNKFISAYLFMIIESSISDFLWASISIVDTLNVEKILQLVFERDRDFKELDSSTSQWTLELIWIYNGYTCSLPSFNTDPAEYVSTFGTLLWIFE